MPDNSTITAVAEILKWAAQAGIAFANARQTLVTAGVDEAAYDAAIADRRTFKDFHGENPQNKPGVPPSTPPTSIYDAAPVRYVHDTDIPSDAELIARGAESDDLVGVTKPGVGATMWKVFRADVFVTEIGQAIPADRRFVLKRVIK